MTTPSRSSQKASTFHPSKIQCSSTPLGQRGLTTEVLDLSNALQDAYDTPIRGHRLRKSSNKAFQKPAAQKRLTDAFDEVANHRPEPSAVTTVDDLNSKLIEYESPSAQPSPLRPLRQQSCATPENNHPSSGCINSTQSSTRQVHAIDNFKAVTIPGGTLHSNEEQNRNISNPGCVKNQKMLFIKPSDMTNKKRSTMNCSNESNDLIGPDIGQSQHALKETSDHSGNARSREHSHSSDASVQQLHLKQSHSTDVVTQQTINNGEQHVFSDLSNQSLENKKSNHSKSLSTGSDSDLQESNSRASYDIASEAHIDKGSRNSSTGSNDVHQMLTAQTCSERDITHMKQRTEVEQQHQQHRMKMYQQELLRQQELKEQHDQYLSARQHQQTLIRKEQEKLQSLLKEDQEKQQLKQQQLQEQQKKQQSIIRQEHEQHQRAYQQRQREIEQLKIAQQRAYQEKLEEERQLQLEHQNLSKSKNHQYQIPDSDMKHQKQIPNAQFQQSQGANLHPVKAVHQQSNDIQFDSRHHIACMAAHTAPNVMNNNKLHAGSTPIVEKTNSNDLESEFRQHQNTHGKSQLVHHSNEPGITTAAETELTPHIVSDSGTRTSIQPEETMGASPDPNYKIGEEATRDFLNALAEIRLTHTWMLENQLPDVSTENPAPASEVNTQQNAVAINGDGDGNSTDLLLEESEKLLHDEDYCKASNYLGRTMEHCQPSKEHDVLLTTDIKGPVNKILQVISSEGRQFDDLLGSPSNTRADVNQTDHNPPASHTQLITDVSHSENKMTWAERLNEDEQSRDQIQKHYNTNLRQHPNSVEPSHQMHGSSGTYQNDTEHSDTDSGRDTLYSRDSRCNPLTGSQTLVGLYN